MFKEILKIIPRLETKDLAGMENSLNKRFGKVAKKFGGGIKMAIKGGLIGMGLGLIEKILNPLKETQEAIDKILKGTDDIVTNATMFGTTAGKLFKMQQLANAAGVDPDDLYKVISRFQTSVAQAKADPTKQTAVRNFTQYDDTLEGFFAFIQSLQKMDQGSQNLAQYEVFGERQILKMADFLQQDFAKLTKMIGAKSAETYTPALTKLAGLSDLNDALSSKRNLEDVLTKGQVVNKGMIYDRDRAEREQLKRENARIRSYSDLQNISNATDKMLTLFEQGIAMVGKLVAQFSGFATKVEGFINDAKKSRLFRGLFGG